MYNYESNPFKNANVGDIVKFGNYPQTANNDILPIEWQVLSKEENKMLVSSKYGLEARCFDSRSSNWKKSEIRKWLNEDFYNKNKVFTEQEKKYINPLDADNVFLLSEEEAEKYFANNEERRCKATDYAVKNGALVADRYFGINALGYSYWWLNSPSSNFDFLVRLVSADGVINYRDIRLDYFVVRPALWINL